MFTNKASFILLLAIGSFSLVQSHGHGPARSSFGEPCGKTQRCDKRAWLGCINDKCDCLKPEEMIYEPEGKKCVSKAGERCKFQLEDSDGNVVFEIGSCVQNAGCRADGFCQCEAGYFEMGHGTCAPYRKYGEKCDTQLKCSTKLGLECGEEGTCKCGNKTSFSEVHNQCVGLVGEDCVGLKCSGNAVCSTRNNKCQCLNGYFKDEENKCITKMGLLKNCTADDQCLDTIPLKCIEGVCNCNANVSVLSKGPKVGDEYPNAVCVGRAASPCILSRCVPGASCRSAYQTSDARLDLEGMALHFMRHGMKKRNVHGEAPWWNTELQNEYGPPYAPPRGSSEEASIPIPAPLGLFPGQTFIPLGAQVPTLQQTCVCDQGFANSKSGTCGKPFGAACIKDECVEGLVCKGNQCSCRYPHQIFSMETLNCHSKIRGPCKTDGDCFGKSSCHLYQNRTFGECKCNPGYIENGKRECEVGFGGNCTTTAECDSVAGLVCLDGACHCGGFAKYDEETRSCFSFVGGDCSAAENVGCVDNAICVGMPSSASGQPTSGTCACGQGFIVTGEYTCVEEGL